MRTLPLIACEHCGDGIRHPRWVRVEPGVYQALCVYCDDERERQFTAEDAICYALIIIGVHQGRMNGPLSMMGASDE
jgi:hypothetical protein